jgi:hypothetical protein
LLYDYLLRVHLPVSGHAALRLRPPSTHLPPPTHHPQVTFAPRARLIYCDDDDDDALSTPSWKAGSRVKISKITSHDDGEEEADDQLSPMMRRPLPLVFHSIQLRQRQRPRSCYGAIATNVPIRTTSNLVGPRKFSATGES